MRLDVPANAPIFENTARRHFTNGYTRGVIRNEFPRKNGCNLIEFHPLDSEQGENKPLPEIQSVVVGREYIKRMARGDDSSRREIVRAVARNPADLPEKMRGTTEGKWETLEGLKAFLEKTFGKTIPVGDDALAELMIEWSRGHISRATLAKIKEEVTEIKKMIPSVKLKEETK